jgi:hypothetical protein
VGHSESASTGNSNELESLDGDAILLDESDLTEINIRGFILSEMDKLYAEYVICARPTLVDDESGNSLQVFLLLFVVVGAFYWLILFSSLYFMYSS